jgi:hypothetical protein
VFGVFGNQPDLNDLAFGSNDLGVDIPAIGFGRRTTSQFDLNGRLIVFQANMVRAA